RSHPPFHSFPTRRSSDLTIFAVGDTEAQIACFERVAADLSPGGRFVVEAFVLDPRMFHHGQALDIRTMTAEHVELQLMRYDPPTDRKSTRLNSSHDQISY